MDQNMPVVQTTEVRKDKSKLVFSGLVILSISLLIFSAVLVYFVLNQNNQSSDIAKDNDSQITSDNKDKDLKDEQKESYKQVIPTGWKNLTDSSSGISFALPMQDSYEPKEGIDYSLVEDMDLKWYVSSNVTEAGHLYFQQGQNFLELSKTPDNYWRSEFGCGLGCVEESFVKVFYYDTNKSLDMLFNEFKDRVAEIDSTPGRADTLGLSDIDNFSTIISSERLEIWGMDAYKIEMLSNINGYLVTNGNRAFYIEAYIEYSEMEVMKVLNTFLFD